MDSVLHLASAKDQQVSLHIISTAEDQKVVGSAKTSSTTSVTTTPNHRVYAETPHFSLVVTKVSYIYFFC